MAEKIKFTSVDTNFEGDKHLELSNKEDIDKLFDKLEESEHSKENQLHDFIKSSLDGVSNTVKLEEAIKETFGEKEKILETNNGIVVNGGLHIHIESKGDREYFLNGLIKEKNEYFKRVLVADDISKKEEEKERTYLETVNKDLDEQEKKNSIDDLTDEQKVELADLKKTVQKEFTVDLVADREVVAGSGEITDEETKGWRGKLKDSFTNMDTESMYKYMAQGVTAMTGIASFFVGFSGNPALKMSVKKLELKGYEMLAKGGNNETINKQIEKANSELAALGEELLAKKTAEGSPTESETSVASTDSSTSDETSPS